MNRASGGRRAPESRAASAETVLVRPRKAVRPGALEVADYMWEKTGRRCKVYAPPGEDYEYRYTRNLGAVVLAETAQPDIAEALASELTNPDSEIFWGPVSHENRESAEEALRDKGLHAAARLLVEGGRSGPGR